MNPEWNEEQRKLYSTLELAITDIVDFAGPKLPAMGNKGTMALVDMGGRLNELQKRSKKMDELFKGILESRLQNTTENELRGEAFKMAIETGITTVRLNQNKAKEMAEQAQWLRAWIMAYIDAEDKELVKCLEKINELGNCMEVGVQQRRTYSRL